VQQINLPNLSVFRDIDNIVFSVYPGVEHAIKTAFCAKNDKGPALHVSFLINSASSIKTT